MCKRIKQLYYNVRIGLLIDRYRNIDESIPDSIVKDNLLETIDTNMLNLEIKLLHANLSRRASLRKKLLTIYYAREINKRNANIQKLKHSHYSTHRNDMIGVEQMYRDMAQVKMDRL